MDNVTTTSDKAEISPEVKARRKMARMIGRIVFQQSYLANHPEASKQEVKAATLEAKAEHGKTGKQVLRALEKSGLMISAPDQ